MYVTISSENVFNDLVTIDFNKEFPRGSATLKVNSRPFNIFNIISIKFIYYY